MLPRRQFMRKKMPFQVLRYVVLSHSGVLYSSFLRGFCKGKLHPGHPWMAEEIKKSFCSDVSDPTYSRFHL